MWTTLSIVGLGGVSVPECCSVMGCGREEEGGTRRGTESEDEWRKDRVR